MNAVAGAARRGIWLGSPLLLLVIAAAWGLAIGAELTGRLQWVHHHHLVMGDIAVWASLALFLLAWQVHIAAMMLPSSLPMIGLFNRAAATQQRPSAARGAFLGGYLLVWSGFGFAALTGDALLHLLIARSHWLMHRPELIAAGALVLAGGFQFSGLKDRCMDKCRHPAAFLMSQYRQGVIPALRTGMHHGLYCLGCCWALMVVMFVVGIANLAWMVPLAMLMFYEKVGPGGDRAVRPVGLALIALGILIAMAPGWIGGPGHAH
ncbi:MAG: DUF2182 domain-containing protein [Ectothiorhodospiraceae bacterium]|nr:DUF2182 domain-containing protein [Ectothiorhodospiraceae bacterium]